MRLDTARSQSESPKRARVQSRPSPAASSARNEQYGWCGDDWNRSAAESPGGWFHLSVQRGGEPQAVVESAIDERPNEFFTVFLRRMWNLIRGCGNVRTPCEFSQTVCAVHLYLVWLCGDWSGGLLPTYRAGRACLMDFSLQFFFLPIFLDFYRSKVMDYGCALEFFSSVKLHSAPSSFLIPFVSNLDYLILLVDFATSADWEFCPQFWKALFDSGRFFWTFVSKFWIYLIGSVPRNKYS